MTLSRKDLLSISLVLLGSGKFIEIKDPQPDVVELGET